MSKRLRWVLFYVAFIIFLAASYGTVVYALGYRYDFMGWKFVRTGSLRVIANTSAEIYLNGKLAGKTSFLGDSFSKGQLLPRTYSVRLEKRGYFSWQKNIPVVAGLFIDIPKVVLLPTELPQEVVATASFGFPLTESKIRPTKGKLLTFDDHEITVEWLNGTDYQPFKNAGDREVILRTPDLIDDVQWYRDHDHIFVASGGTLYFHEIDKRGGLNSFPLASIKEPFYYDADENAVFLMEHSEIMKMKLP